MNKYLLFFFNLIYCFCMPLGAFAQTGVSKLVRINMHFMLRNDGSGNHNEYWDGISDSTMNAYHYAQLVVQRANVELDTNHQMFRTKDGVARPVQAIGMHYQLMGVYFHRDDKFQNDDFYSGWEILDRYGVNPKSEINVFMIVPDNDGSGIAITILNAEEKNPSLATKVSIYSTYKKYPEWSIQYAASNINHEIGHLLGLQHTWNEDDGCPDTPLGYRNTDESYTQCWGYKDKGGAPCNSWANVSNNIMDYNENFPHAYTPCQIEKLQAILATSAKGFVADAAYSRSLLTTIQVADTCSANAVRFVGFNNDLRAESKMEVYDLKKNKNIPLWLRPRVKKTDWAKPNDAFYDLHQDINFKSGHYYTFIYSVRARDGSTQKTKKTIFVK